MASLAEKINDSGTQKKINKLRYIGEMHFVLWRSRRLQAHFLLVPFCLHDLDQPRDIITGCYLYDSLVGLNQAIQFSMEGGGGKYSWCYG